MRNFLSIVGDLTYLIAVGLWVVVFFFDKEAANTIFPLIVVLCLFNIASRVRDIYKHLKEVSNAKD
jgi:hypothetical protein